MRETTAITAIIENKADGVKQLREWEALLANAIRDPVDIKQCQEITWHLCEILGALVRIEPKKESND
jgi:hypothetical protein